MGLCQRQTSSKSSPGIPLQISLLTIAFLLTFSTRKDATLREVLSTLRNTAPHVAEYKHPLAKFSFRTVYADPSNKGRYSQKDMGMVYSRDILGEPGSLNTPAPRLLLDAEPLGERERNERNLEELRFIPGDFLL